MEDDVEDQEVALVFEVATAATAWFGGQQVVRRRDSYSPLWARLKSNVTPSDILVIVRTDGSESLEYLPFGGQIDLLT